MLNKKYIMRCASQPAFMVVFDSVYLTNFQTALVPSPMYDFDADAEEYFQSLIDPENCGDAEFEPRDD